MLNFGESQDCLIIQTISSNTSETVPETLQKTASYKLATLTQARGIFKYPYLCFQDFEWKPLNRIEVLLGIGVLNINNENKSGIYTCFRDNLMNNNVHVLQNWNRKPKVKKDKWILSIYKKVIGLCPAHNGTITRHRV